MTNNINAKLIAKQSKIDRDLDKAIQVIEPFVCTGKKITKREIDKAQKALDEVFGRVKSVDGEYNYSIIHVSLRKDYFTKVNLYHQNRSIQGEKYTSYLKDYERSITCDGETGTLEAEEIRRYIRNNPIISEKQAQKLIDKHEKLQQRINKLQDEQRSIKYGYYLR